MSAFHLVIKDFQSSGKIEEARSAQGAALYPRFASDILVLCFYRVANMKTQPSGITSPTSVSQQTLAYYYNSTLETALVLVAGYMQH